MTAATEISEVETVIAEDFANTIGLDLDDWPGNCYAVASMIVDEGMYKGAEAVFGHYYGPIDPAGHFGYAADSPFVQHGWIDLTNEDGKIIDPTRWVFEDTDPYIYAGPDGEYDRGGQRIRDKFQDPPPENPDGDLTRLELPVETARFLVTLLGGQTERQEFYFEELIWLANLPVDTLDDHAEPFYRGLIDADHKALIPIDHRNLILPEEG